MKFKLINAVVTRNFTIPMFINPDWIFAMCPAQEGTFILYQEGQSFIAAESMEELHRIFTDENGWEWIG